MAGVLIREKIRAVRLAGIVIGFAGAVMLMLSSQNSVSRSDNPFGDLLIFVNALSWGTYLVLVKPFMKKYNTVTILKWTFLFGFIFVLPFGYRELGSVNWSQFTPAIWFD